MTRPSPIERAEERRAHFGILAAIAQADGHLDDTEIDLFDELLALHGATEGELDTFHRMLSGPPGLEEGTRVLRASPARFTSYLDACFMVRADEVLTEEEARILDDLVELLGLSDDQVDALEELAGLVGAAQLGDPDEDTAGGKTLEQALADVAAAGIPASAIGHRVP